MLVDTKQKKQKILFIAKNIPVPGIRPSRVIMAIAHEVSSFSNISFLYPNEIVPFGFQFLKKYKPFYKLKSWECEGFDIAVTQYLRIPFRGIAFWCWNKLSKQDIAYYEQAGPFDLIHAHYLFPDGYFAYLFSMKYAVSYVITIRNADIKYLKNISRNNSDFKKAQLIIKHAQKVFSLNLAYKNFVDELFGISSLIIPHGIEKNAYYEKPKQQNKKIVITVVSEAIKRKNIDWVIKGFKKYIGKHSIELHVIGKGPLLNRLKLLAGNDKRIFFHGKINRPEVMKRLQDSDIFALPSYDETFGLVYLEAAATKNAIIGSKNEGVWGIFEDEKEMLFSSDEMHFQQLLLGLIEDHKLRSKLQEEAFNKVKQLNWDIISERYKKVYEECIGTLHINTDS